MSRWVLSVPESPLGDERRISVDQDTLVDQFCGNRRCRQGPSQDLSETQGGVDDEAEAREGRDEGESGLKAIE
ncbi:hypothetical protein [Amycolatopsis sp. CB00013]|uniref:hypothetical protein n=1 Tax=Amycolatopsis sp. CB00013 TaxID=1703945 RepID=UPI001161178A|nr:hypothetical protein [Amycolatopsis sp. CB00013]